MLGTLTSRAVVGIVLNTIPHPALQVLGIVAYIPICFTYRYYEHAVLVNPGDSPTAIEKKLGRASIGVPIDRLVS